LKQCDFVSGECVNCGLKVSGCAADISVVCGSIVGELHCRGLTSDAVIFGPSAIESVITPTPGLGDYTEQLLSSLGVTKDRYSAAKKLFGLAPTCNCETRKEWLNKVGAWLGL
jgi:hypothetical protein